MKNKFRDDPDGPDRFEFHEAYWQQAEALIAADEARRRRRRRFWFWMSSCLLLGLAAGLWWYGADGSLANGSEQTEVIGSATPPDDAAAQVDNSHSPAGTGTALPEGRLADPSGRESSVPENLSPQAVKEAARPATLDGNTDQSVEQKRQRQGGALLQHGKTQNSTSARGLSTSAPMNPASQPNAAQANLPIPAVNDQAAVAKPTGVSDSLASSTDNPLPATNHQLLFSPLPTLLRLLEPFPPHLPVLTVPPPPAVAERIDPVRDSRFSLGLSAFGSAYLPVSTAQGFGGGAGLTARYRLNPSFALQVEARWRARQMSEFVEVWAPESAERLRYSFGFEQDQYTLEGRASHWLETPVSVQWQQGRWGAEVGVAPGFLLAVQGRVTHERETSLTDRRVTRQAVTLSRKPFYPNYFAVLAGGQYTLTRRWSAGLRLHYLGGDFRRPTDAYEPPRQTLWVDAGLHYRLF